MLSLHLSETNVHRSSARYHIVPRRAQQRQCCPVPGRAQQEAYCRQFHLAGMKYAIEKGTDVVGAHVVNFLSRYL